MGRLMGREFAMSPALDPAGLVSGGPMSLGTEQVLRACFRDWSDLGARLLGGITRDHDHVGGLVLDHLWQAIKPSCGHRHPGASSHAW